MKVKEAIESRWSPRAFDYNKAISKEDLQQIIEAAASAASCFNEQPWRFIIGVQKDETYQSIFESLVPFNKDWAQTAPVLMVTVAAKEFKKNGNDNPHARYDLGQSVGILSLKAMELGVYVHQMAGFDPQVLREQFEIPNQFDVVSVIALGYPGDKSQLSADLAAQESPERTNLLLSEIAFNKKWGKGVFS